MHQDAKKTSANLSLKTNLKTVIAKAKVSGDLQEAFSALDKAAKRQLIHKNKADRQKSRLSRFAKVAPKPSVAPKAVKKKAKVK